MMVAVWVPGPMRAGVGVRHQNARHGAKEQGENGCNDNAELSGGTPSA